MKFTWKKQDEYKARILAEIKQATSVDMSEFGVFYTTRKAAEVLVLNIHPHASKDFVEVRKWGYFCYYYPDDLICPIYHQPYKVISRKHFDNLYQCCFTPEEILPSLDEWNNLICEHTKLEMKKLQNKKELAELQLEFDDSITLGEIRKEYPGLYVSYRKTKLSFHQWANAEMNRYWSKPKFTIKIKPVKMDNLRIDNYVYNKKEFNKKMDEVDI